MLPGISSSRHGPTPITPEHIPIMKVSALNTSETLCLDAPMAVSYTHLDVYKRQEYQLRVREEIYLDNMLDLF